MKIIKYPVRIRGEEYTAEVKFSQSGDDMVMIQTELYHGIKRCVQKPDFVFRHRIPIEVYIREAEQEMELMEEMSK